MIESIQKFFQQRLEPTAGELTPQERLPVATCALLLEVAHADDDFSPVEREVVVQNMRRLFGVSAEDADRLIDLAEAERDASADLYQFARLINQHFTRTDKLRVLELLWQVVYSDGRLEKHEDALMHKLSNLLELRHDELIALKLRVKRGAERAADSVEDDDAAGS
jgi:uncharacterized tellurite resistance protein B-like protein